MAIPRPNVHGDVPEAGACGGQRLEKTRRWGILDPYRGRNRSAEHWTGGLEPRADGNASEPRGNRCQSSRTTTVVSFTGFHIPSRRETKISDSSADHDTKASHCSRSIEPSLDYRWTIYSRRSDLSSVNRSRRIDEESPPRADRTVPKRPEWWYNTTLRFPQSPRETLSLARRAPIESQATTV
ncbi:hypothetical protein BJ546DRAFT_254256 [Cryomyces antarcticus]